MKPIGIPLLLPYGTKLDERLIAAFPRRSDFHRSIQLASTIDLPWRPLYEHLRQSIEKP